MKHGIEPHDLLVALLLVENALERRSESFFQGFGLTGAQFNILNLLALADGPMDQMDLVERLLVGKSSISIVLNRMAKAGLISRQEHERDRRQMVLSLTRHGRSLWRKISARYELGVEDVFGALPKERRLRFVEDLETLYAALKVNPESATDAVVPTLRETLAQLSPNS